ncbi:uncharacterized protein OCT59_023608 [Rhizophagus irregularis]|uniref:Sel1 repeat domain-containing protein n=1 Tax=Rhizophagus irregularis (strain DAOM 197198w) TaxID=1432141 RepID=A0A015JRB7_RHIIW|nr:hypothetical protein RirG_072630 [Rhizophagus irregularis DAOM 197198w]UZO03199.1 hypothetical protein OCT59_023608 [Rhizophagus irregularis]
MQLNLDNIDSSNTNNSLKGFSQIIQNFDKININEIEPITQNIHENIFEEDLSIIIDEMINLIFKGLNEGKDEEILKNNIINYINNHKILTPEIYNWLLNNQYNSNSICLLGYFNYYGIGTIINKQKVIELYHEATILENSVAQLNLAEMYIHGEGVDINNDLAFELYEELADKEIPNAIDKLGYCYEMGIGTVTNWQRAFELFQKAADLGNANGMNNLGNCYYNGIGIDINDYKAFELYQKAANLDNYLAQCNLALMYEYGNGIGKNINQAIYWYNKSAKQGYQYAQNKLKELTA